MNIQPIPKTFVEAAEKLFNATPEHYYVGLHDINITPTNEMWKTAKTYGANWAPISFNSPRANQTWESMKEEQVYFLLLIAAAEGEL